MLMIVVNMSISDELAYAQFLHASWNGFTLTDLVFPTFLFVVGTAMAFTHDRYRAMGANAFFGKTFRRGALIFLCGVFVSNFPFFRIMPSGTLAWTQLADLRIMGVLQRIGLTFILATLVRHAGGWRGALVYALLVLPAYGLTLLQFGDLSLNGNVGLKLDTFLLGASHLYRGEGVPFDPEGVLGAFPAVVNVLAGWAAATWLRGFKVDLKRLAPLAGLAVVLVLLALALNGILPINKKLWTPSYVVLTIGLDLLILALLALIIDVRGLKFGTGYFAVLGKNTLAIYMLAEMGMAIAWTLLVRGEPLFMAVYDGGFRWMGGKFGALVLALVYAQACWLVAWVLDQRKIYIRL